MDSKQTDIMIRNAVAILRTASITVPSKAVKVAPELLSGKAVGGSDEASRLFFRVLNAMKKAPESFDTAGLQKLHALLFESSSDAGKLRDLPASLRGSSFADCSLIAGSLKRLLAKMSEIGSAPELLKEDFAITLTHYFSEIYFLCPFSVGEPITEAVFLYHFALQHGFRIDYSVCGGEKLSAALLMALMTDEKNELFVCLNSSISYLSEEVIDEPATVTVKRRKKPKEKPREKEKPAPRVKPKEKLSKDKPREKVAGKEAPTAKEKPKPKDKPGLKDKPLPKDRAKRRAPAKVREPIRKAAPKAPEAVAEQDEPKQIAAGVPRVAADEAAQATPMAAQTDTARLKQKEQSGKAREKTVAAPIKETERDTSAEKKNPPAAATKPSEEVAATVPNESGVKIEDIPPITAPLTHLPKAEIAVRDDDKAADDGSDIAEAVSSENGNAETEQSADDSLNIAVAVPGEGVVPLSDLSASTLRKAAKIKEKIESLQKQLQTLIERDKNGKKDGK